jgi:hypothetical protein
MKKGIDRQSLKIILPYYIYEAIPWIYNTCKFHQKRPGVDEDSCQNLFSCNTSTMRLVYVGIVVYVYRIWVSHKSWKEKKVGDSIFTAFEKRFWSWFAALYTEYVNYLKWNHIIILHFRYSPQCTSLHFMEMLCFGQILCDIWYRKRFLESIEEEKNYYPIFYA